MIFSPNDFLISEIIHILCGFDWRLLSCCENVFRLHSEFNGIKSISVDYSIWLSKVYWYILQPFWLGMFKFWILWNISLFGCGYLKWLQWCTCVGCLFIFEDGYISLHHYVLQSCGYHLVEWSLIGSTEWVVDKLCTC